MLKEQKNNTPNIYCKQLQHYDANRWTIFKTVVPFAPTETSGMIHVIHVQNSGTNYICEKKYDLSKLRQNYKRLKDFANFEYDWNDNKGSPIPITVLNIARKLLPRLEFQPEIFPTGRDTIQFEYTDEDGNYLEFEIYKKSIVAYIQINDQEYEFEIGEEFIPELVNYFNAIHRDIRWGEIIQSYKKNSRLVEF